MAMKKNGSRDQTAAKSSKPAKERKPKYKIGDRVKIINYPGTFEWKGKKYTLEGKGGTISRVYGPGGNPLYAIKVEGYEWTFYESNLVSDSAATNWQHETI